jgi:hypothetical protein
MASLKFTQPQVNVLRALLGQEGWAKDFGDFYDAGKALSEWPKDKYLPQSANAEQFEALMKETHDLEVSEKSKAMLEKALKHYVAKAGAPSMTHFEVLQVLGIDRL